MEASEDITEEIERDAPAEEKQKRMNIRIGEFRIKSDSAQFTLYKIRIKGEKAAVPGSEQDVFSGYYSTFESCLKAIPTKALCESEVESLADAMRIVESYRDMISDALKGV